MPSLAWWFFAQPLPVFVALAGAFFIFKGLALLLCGEFYDSYFGAYILGVCFHAICWLT